MTLKHLYAGEKPRARFGWSRPPFYILGLLSPFFLGTALAWQMDRTFSLPVFSLALVGLILLIFTADQAAQHLNSAATNSFPHPLTGRTALRLNDFLTAPLRAGILALILTGIIGLVLQFNLYTGPFTVILGLPIILPVLSYLPQPIRLVERGYGELLLAACYGLLPLALSFYLQRGYVHPFLPWMALPIGFSIFNVIMVSEFRRSTTVSTDDGRNLMTRLGPAKARSLIALVSILSWLALYASLLAGIPRRAIFFYLPVLALSAFLSLMMVRKRYEDPLMLEIIRGLTVAVSLGTMVVYLLAFL